MSAPPRLSVVMPVHDAAGHLDEAITSVLEQTFTDFELVAVDDHSADASLEMLRTFAATDDRIHVVALDQQLGVAGALNIGIERATAPLLARMDADDIARPERFATQVAEMERDPALGLIGAQIDVIGDDGAPAEMHPWVLPSTHDETVWGLIFGTPICHPTVVLRTEVVRRLGGYDPAFPNEDMELWTRMAFVSRMRNLDTVLLSYRMPTHVHTEKLAAWQPHITRVSQRYLERIVGAPVAHDVVVALRAVTGARGADDLFAAVSELAAASLLVHAFSRMRDVGVLTGDGVERVAELMEWHVHELATKAHVDVAGRV